tara:strand:+ start:1799 stop:2638 length:840 start_codon:yes stop_codon:yes gene_type:complete
MEEHSYVEFKRERDLGAIITDTFKFIRIEWKPFFTFIFKVAIIPILLSFGISAYANTFVMNPSFNIAPIVLNLFNYLLLCVIYYLITLSALSYIKSYIENNGAVDVSEINAYKTANMLPFLGMGFVSWILITVSVVLCFFPAFYTVTVLSFVGCIYIFENKTSMDSIGACFSFVKGHFWESLGILFVVGLLLAVLGFVFSLPTVIYTMIEAFSVMQSNDVTQISGLFSNPVFLLFAFISSIAQQLFGAVFAVSIAFIYFDINEQKNASGTIDQIDDLGR